MSCKPASPQEATTSASQARRLGMQMHRYQITMQDAESLIRKLGTRPSAIPRRGQRDKADALAFNCQR